MPGWASPQHRCGVGDWHRGASPAGVCGFPWSGGEKWLLWKEVETQTWLLSDPWAGIIAWKSVTICPLPVAVHARSPDVVSAGPSSAMLLAEHWVSAVLGHGAGGQHRVLSLRGGCWRGWCVPGQRGRVWEVTACFPLCLVACEEDCPLSWICPRGAS